MAVTARMYVREITQYAHAPGSKNVQMVVVSRGVENKEWAAATPTGSAVLGISNQGAADQFLLGEEYLVTFEHSPKTE